MTTHHFIGTPTGGAIAESETWRIGCVSYLNTLPLIEGLSKLPRMTLVPRPPSELLEMLERDEIDIGLVSVVDSARASDELALLPVGMIASLGQTLTVRMFSSVPIQQITRLHADTDSHTSVVLAKILLNERFGISPDVIEFDAREHRAVREQTPSLRNEASIWPESVLLIGDKVVSDTPPASLYPHSLDLGETWRELTGLPFVYAVWMCKRDRAHDPSVRLAAAMLDRQRKHNATRTAWIASTNAAEHGWPRELAHEYLTNKLVYDVDDDARSAVHEFLTRAHGLSLIERPSRAQWLDL